MLLWYKRMPAIMRRGLPVAAITLVLFLASASSAMAQQPPPQPPAPPSQPDPPVQTDPTPDGLGNCVEGIRVEVLNSRWNALPEDQATRHGHGGFDAFVLMNCRAHSIEWEIIDQNGRVVDQATALVHDKFDDFEWIDLEITQYQTHKETVFDVEGNVLFAEGDVILDADGNAIPLMEQPVPVTVYRFTFEYDNPELIDGVRPMTANQDYLLSMDVIPYEGAPENHIISETIDIIAKLGGNWWNKLIRILSPTHWLDQGTEFIMTGLGSVAMGGMCVVMGNFMTEEEKKGFDHYDSDGNGTLDKKVDNADDPNKPNGNGNCKNRSESQEDILRDTRARAFEELNEQLIAEGLPPRKLRGTRDTYLSEVLDGRDPRSNDIPVAVQVRYDLNHILLAPQMVVDALDGDEEDIIEGGITTFTGIFVGTPPELTYERGIVRIGWSAMMNVMVSFIALVVAWTGLRQVVRGFLGSPQGIVDWREAIPRLMLALIAAVTSYWWCSLLIDLADGVSRYIAAAMRVTPADVTLTLGQALLAVLIKSNARASWILGFIPFSGLAVTVINMGLVSLQVALMKVFSITVLMVAAQFVMRIALLNLLVMISPLAMLMWALPETSGWGRRWASTFGTTLFQHGLQLTIFAFALWSVRKATVIGIVADTGSLASLAQTLLPTQMLWALVLGILAMVATFKVPSLLGQGGLQESFISTIGIAAGGMGALLGGAGSGLGGLPGVGISGSGSPISPSSPLGQLASKMGFNVGGQGGAGVAQSVTATASNFGTSAAAGVASGIFSGVKHFISGGVSPTPGPDISGGGPPSDGGISGGDGGGGDTGGGGGDIGGDDDMGGGVGPTAGSGPDDSGPIGGGEAADSDPIGGEPTVGDTPSDGVSASAGDASGGGTSAGGAGVQGEATMGGGTASQGEGDLSSGATAGAPPPPAASASTPRQQYDADEKMIKGEVGRKGLSKMRSSGLMADTEGRVRDSSGHRDATPSEQKLISQMGRQRFNSAVHGGRPESQVGDGPSFMQRAREAIRYGGQQGMQTFSNWQQSSHVPMVQDMRTGEVRLESPDEQIARAEMGDAEYWGSSERDIQYHGHGAMVDTGDRVRTLTGDETYARDVMGDQDFSNAMGSSLRVVEGSSTGGVHSVSENGQIRASTAGEERAISGMGVQGFNRAFGTRQEFLGDGAFVRDGGAVRPATEGETNFLNRVEDPSRFNSVMRQSTRFAGDANRAPDPAPSFMESVRAMPEDARRVRHGAGVAGGFIRQGASVAGDAASRGASRASDAASHAADAARERIRHTFRTGKE